jgi:secondary thiamine-phosphate synthase enzyme
MIYQKDIILPPFRKGFHLITEIIEREMEFIPESGMLILFLKHTSAAITLNENADPSVRKDFETFIGKMVPENFPLYIHTLEGPDDMPAHIKSSFFGVSINIPIKNKTLNLGMWQGIYLCEFRNNGGRRNLVLTILY